MEAGGRTLGVASILDESTVGIYRYAVRKGGIDSAETVAEDLNLELGRVRAGIQRLRESRLLQPESDDLDPLLLPVDPRTAATLLVSPMEQEIYQRREQIAQVQEWTEVFSRDYVREDTLAAGLPSEPIAGSLEVRGYLRTAAETCAEEVLLLHAGGDADVLDDFASECLALLERGVSVRILFQHRSRADMVTRTTVRAMLDAGAEVRTVCQAPRDAVVFDRSLAVLIGETDDEDIAVRVADQEVVDFLLDLFEHQWDLATPLQRLDIGYAEVTDDLHQTIASLMAKGYTDEVLARKLGMSVRTCRRHIAELMRNLDAVSRFQAGCRAASQDLVKIA